MPCAKDKDSDWELLVAVLRIVAKDDDELGVVGEMEMMQRCALSRVHGVQDTMELEELPLIS